MRRTFEIVAVLENGIKVVKRNGVICIITEQDEFISRSKFDEILETSEEDFYVVRRVDKYGIVSRNGDEVCPIEYSRIYIDENKNIFPDGYARVYKRCKVGLMNKLGKNITEVKYDDIGRCRCGVFVVKLNGKLGILSRRGRELTRIIYDAIKLTDYGLIEVEINGKWGLIDKKGELINFIDYDKIYGNIGKSEIIIKVERKGKFGLCAG